MKTILHYCISTHLGGAEQSLLTLVKETHIKYKGTHRSHLILPKNTGPLIDELEKYDIPYSVVPFPEKILSFSRQSEKLVQSLLNLRFIYQLYPYLKDLRRCIKEVAPDIICTTGIKCHFLVQLLKLDIPVVWYLRDIVSNPILQTSFHLLNNPKTSVIANSISTGTSIKLPHDVIYNGFEVPPPRENIEFFLHETCQLEKNTPLIGVLGVLTPWKGQKEFIQMAYKLIHEKACKAHFVIIGDEIYDTQSDGSYKQQLMDLAEGLGILDRVHFTGFIKESDQALRSLTILTHTSINPEPFGRVIVEAMLHGVPVVASGEGGAIEIITNENEGFTCEPRNVDQYVEKVDLLLKDEELLKKISHQARLSAVERFSQDTYIQAVVEHFDSHSTN